jgi:hypothetical protein
MDMTGKDADGLRVLEREPYHDKKKKKAVPVQDQL